jgi:hypothetical protein
MNNTLTHHLRKVIDAALSEEKTPVEKVADITKVFDDIAVEMGYLDQRREEAEESTKQLLISIQKLTAQ